ncbi:MAG: hypothetical protein N3G80_00790 [Candidatus Micrarchaeota archaeon]|nr:hypothetical protein [Candidatus Micrarchaeota archaeon]
MRKFHFFLLFLSAVLYGFNLDDFVPQNTSYTVQNFTHGGEFFSAVVVEGQLYAFVGKGKAVQDLQQIKSLLHSYYLWQGYSPKAVEEFSAVHEGILKIKDKRKENEAKCKVVIGTDRTVCDSFEHCLQACYSVTSLCQPVALGAGRPFIEAIWSFENDTKQLDRAYEEEQKAYEQLLLQPNKSSVQNYLSALAQINKVATKLSSNPLFDYYSFCYPPDYALPNLTVLQLQAQKAHSNLSVFFEIDSAAQRVFNLTDYGVKKLEYLEAARQAQSWQSQNLSPATSLPAKQEAAANRTSQQKQAEPTEERYINPLVLVFVSLAVFGLLAGSILLFLKMKRRL